MKLFLPVLLWLAACTAQNSQRGPSSSGSFLKSLKELGEETYQGPLALEAKGHGGRRALAYLPNDYDGKDKWPLVILLHGFGSTAEEHDNYLALRFRATRRGFLFVTPEGTKTPPGTRVRLWGDVTGKQFWNATDFCCDFGKTGVDDVGYITALIGAAKAKYKVDPRRIYVIGHSNGGFMANRLACEKVGAQIAGIANIAGGSFKNAVLCAKPKAIPFLQVHAVDDPTVLYGDAPRYAGGEETIRQWTRKNACSAPELKEKESDHLLLIPGQDTSERSWKSCKSGKEVALWTIRAHKAENHNSHVPAFQLTFMESVLDFLLRQSL